MIDLSVLTEKASLVAKEAGTYLRERQRTFDRSVVELKSMNALVSDVDRSTEELIVQKLMEVFPEAGFLTEEETTTQKNRFRVHLGDRPAGRDDQLCSWASHLQC